MKRNVLKKLLLILGIFLILIGIILLYFSLSKEVIEDNYVIEEFKGYTSSLNNLEKGQIEVIQNIVYQGKGTFKVTFTNYANKNTDKIVKDDTKLIISDYINSDYELLNQIVINNTNYSFKNNTFKDKDNIEINYNKYDKLIEISIPNNLIKEENNVSIFMKIKNHDVGYKHYTNKDCYFSIDPDLSNEYYTKSGIQSYIIYGKGYITLK